MEAESSRRARSAPASFQGAQPSPSSFAVRLAVELDIHLPDLRSDFRRVTVALDKLLGRLVLKDEGPRTAVRARGICTRPKLHRAVVAEVVLAARRPQDGGTEP